MRETEHSQRNGAGKIDNLKGPTMKQDLDGSVEYYPPGAGIDLSDVEVENIKGWLARGDSVTDVAKRTGLKPKVVEEINFGKRFAWTRPAESWELPDAKVYPKKAIGDALIRINEIMQTVNTLYEYEE